MASFRSIRLPDLVWVVSSIVESYSDKPRVQSNSTAG